MKKLVLVGMMLAAIFASCNNEDLANVASGNAIEFDGFVNKSTRSTVDLTNQTLDNFTVYGFMETAGGVLFDAEPVVKNAQNVWTYSHKQYWTPGKSYFFSAIAPTKDAQWSYDTNNTTQGGIITYTNGEGKQDLVYAFSTAKYNMVNSTPKVGFNFYHLLSRVAFSFTNKFTNSNITLRVKDIIIRDAVNKATIDMAVPTNGWVAAEDSETALNFGASTQIAAGETGACDHRYMIPVTKDYVLDFTVQMYQGSELAGEYSHTVEISKFDILSNQSYRINGILAPENINPSAALEEIQFEISGMTDWL